MRKIVLVVCTVLCCFSPVLALSQDCKPDISAVDKITKQSNNYWTQTISTSDVAVTLFVAREGSDNEIGVMLDKQEASATNAQFESALRAAKGNQFYLGLKNGTPLTFVASDVSNKAGVSGSFMAGFTGKNLVTNVQLWAVVPNNELAALRDALTHTQIDGVRIVLSGDVRIERSVNDKAGTKMMEKFGCFYRYLDKEGVGVQATPPPPQKPNPQKSETAALTIDQVIQMVSAKLPDDIIITSIQKSGAKIEINTDILIKLKSAGASDSVLRALMQ